jgi:hypothetical protein
MGVNKTSGKQESTNYETIRPVGDKAYKNQENKVIIQFNS